MPSGPYELPAPLGPRRAEVRLVEVDAEGADASPPRDVQAALRVAGPDGGREPEAVVGEPDRLRLVLVADHRGDRPADLLPGDRHLRSHVGEHGRLVEVAADWRGGGAPPT